MNSTRSYDIFLRLKFFLVFTIIPECSVFRVLSHGTSEMSRNVPCSGFYRRPCVEGLCVFIPSCRQNTEPKTHDSKKNKSQSWENTTLKTLKCVSWSKMDRKSCTKSNFCTENKKTNSPFYEAAKLLVFTVATSGRRCGIMLISSKNWTFHFRWPSFYKKRKENCILLDLCPNDHDAL